MASLRHGGLSEGRSLTCHGERPSLSPWSQVIKAAIAIAEADAEDDRAFEAARVRLKAVAMVWMGGKGRPKRVRASVPPRVPPRSQPVRDAENVAA